MGRLTPEDVSAETGVWLSDLLIKRISAGFLV